MRESRTFGSGRGWCRKAPVYSTAWEGAKEVGEGQFRVFHILERLSIQVPFYGAEFV